MATFLLIIKILGYLASGILASIVFIKRELKAKEARKKLVVFYEIELQKKDESIRFLTARVKGLIKLEEEKNDVKIKVKNAKKELDDISDTELNDRYDDSLSNMPKKSR
jgi:hypothetical protein